MKVLYGGVWIAAGGAASPSNVSVNGQQVVDEAEFFRAVARSYFPRFNRNREFSFTVNVEYGSLLLAELALLTGYDNLPDQGDVSIYCGPDAAGAFQVVTLQNAVLESQPAKYNGMSVQFTYNFKGGIPRTDLSPGGQQPSTALYMRGTTSIGSGASSVAVTFSQPMSSTPVVVANVQRPNGGDAIWAIIRDATVSVNGFTADLSGPTPGTGYLLSWIALL